MAGRPPGVVGSSGSSRSSGSSGSFGAPKQLQRAVRRALGAVARPERAAGAQAYMKSAMPFLGVSAPDLRRALRPVFASAAFKDAAAWRDAALVLWRGARHREERYAAIELVEQRRFDDFQTLDALPMYEEMVATGAWWDVVDPIATHRLRRLLEKEPRPMAASMRAWSRDQDLWKRRAAILCQVLRKESTDRELLSDTIEPNLERREFWLRKAIGWALRDLAWSDPAEVLRYVEEKGARLSPLSRREALRVAQR